MPDTHSPYDPGGRRTAFPGATVSGIVGAVAGAVLLPNPLLEAVFGAGDGGGPMFFMLAEAVGVVCGALLGLAGGLGLWSIARRLWRQSQR
jgi:hypothetical protein